MPWRIIRIAIDIKGGTMQMTSPNRPAHAVAMRTVARHFPRLLLMLCFQLLLRALALAPFLYAAAGYSLPLFPEKHATAYGLMLCVLLYLLLVMPFRYSSRGMLSRLSGAEPSGSMSSLAGYGRWLAASALRMLRALPFLLPLLALSAAFYYYWNMTGFNEFGLMVRTAGTLIGGDYVHGVALIAFAFTAFAVLAVLGWHRDTAFDYQPVGALGVSKALTRAKAIRKMRFNNLKRTSFINALICLPALACVVIIAAFHLNSLMTGDLQWDFSILLTTLTTFDFPTEVYLRMLVGLAVLYLPFVYLRKAALAVTVERAAVRLPRRRR